MIKLLSLILLSLSFSAFAQDFCGRRQPDISSLLRQSTSRVAFKNGGGLFNGGVCWWHSRLQRSSAYLVRYAPEGVRPNAHEVQVILRSLREMDRVVTIQGYEDFESFSHDYQKEIQAFLNDWQKLDGFFNFEWMRGISGRSRLNDKAMRLRMKDVFTHFQNSPVPLWIMAQIKGITSHSLLVLSMSPRANGYDLEVIDSNLPDKTRKIEYYFGDQNLRMPGSKYTFVPYVGFQNDFRKIAEALKRHCPNKEFSFDLLNLKDGDVELSR